MITPAFGLTATERVLPRLALDFTTASLDSRITFTRSGNTATVTNSFGVIVAVNANIPRFDYDPSTLLCKGLLIEEQRTNLLLNSLLDGTILSTQVVTTTATATTLSFYGTGQIVLSGTHSATVVGTGAYPSRKTYTFTPTAGVLTLTVTGTVQYAQLEAGAFATSYIPTTASTVTRTADVATMTGTNFSDWWNTTNDSLVFQYQYLSASTGGALGGVGLNTFNTNARFNVVNAIRATGTSYPSPVINGTSAFGTGKLAICLKANDYRAFRNGVNVTTDANGTMIPNTATTFNIGSGYTGDTYMNGYMQKISAYPMRLTNAELAAFSK